MGGSKYNTSSIDNIEKIKIEYSTPNGGDDRPTLYYGKNGFEKKRDLELSSSIKSLEIEVDSANYFKIESGDT